MFGVPGPLGAKLSDLGLGGGGAHVYYRHSLKYENQGFSRVPSVSYRSWIFLAVFGVL